MSDPRALRTRRNRFVVETLEGRQLLNGSVDFGVAHPAAHVSIQNHQQPTAHRWDWLRNTYWFVPTRNLAATVYDSGSGQLTPVGDQTVYHISGYKNGFFWGETVTQIGSGGSASSSALVGSVTPQGKVLLSFSRSTGVTEGFGTMIRMNGRWTMQNQMFTSISRSASIGHWAYMEQTRPGMKSWNSLPMVKMSVPDFLGQYDAPVPTPTTST